MHRTAIWRPATLSPRGYAPEPPATAAGRRRGCRRRRAAARRRAATRTTTRRPSDGQLNVLVLIIDSLRAGSRRRVSARRRSRRRTSTRSPTAGVRFSRAFPEAMVTVPARRSIFGSRRIFPFRDWTPNTEIGTSPGWLPIDDPQKTFTTALRDNGYWTAQVSDNPFIAFMKAFEPFRQTFHEWQTIVGQSGFRQDPRERPARGGRPLAAPFLRDDRYMPGMRKYLANTGEGRDEEETCAARVFMGARDVLDDARRREPFALTWTASTRTSPGARRRSTSTCTAIRATRAPRWASTPYGFAQQLHARAAAPPPRRVRRRGHDDGQLARALHGALPRARAPQEHGDRAAGRPRLSARRARLHRQGALAAPPRARAGAVRGRAPGRPRGAAR